MAINESLVKFGYGVASKAVKEAGHITFASDTRQLFVGVGGEAVAFAGNVANAVFADSKLTITYNDGTETAVLDFSDVASAEGVSSLLSGLRDDVSANATAIANLSTTVTNLDTSYKTADTKIREDFAAADKAINDKIGGEFNAENTVAKAIEDAKNAAVAAGTVVAEDSDFITIEQTGETGKTQTYTIKTTNIASATDLLDVSTKANAAATNADLTAHTENGDIHVTAAEKTRWSAAAQDIEDFFYGALEDGAEQVKDTLREIQDYITSDASAAATMAENITKAQDTADQAVLDASTAQDTADQALALGQAAAVKTTTDASLNLKADKTALEATDASITAIKNSYVISFGGAKGAISVDTTNASDGEVKFVMDGSTLKGSVNGWNKLGTAAFTDSNAYDAAGAAADVKSEIIGDSVNDTAASLTIQGVKKYADEVAEQAQNAATVTGVDNTSKSDDEGYVTIALALDNKNVKVNSVTVETKSVVDASVDNNGLATALDVKNYVDSKELRWTVLS